MEAATNTAPSAPVDGGSASNDNTESNETGQQNKQNASSPIDSIWAQIDGMQSEHAEELQKRLFKKAPIKTKSGKDEFIVDDLEKVKKAVGIERHFSKIGAEMKAQKEALEEKEAKLSRFFGGDADAIREILAAQPQALRAVHDLLSKDYERESKYAQMDPQTREYALQADKMRSELERLKAEQEAGLAQARQRQEEQLYRQAKEEMEGFGISVLQSAKIPKELAEDMWVRLAPMVEQNLALGSPLNEQQLGQMLMEKVQSEHRMLSNNRSGEELIHLWGEENAKRVAKAFVDRMKGSRARNDNQEHTPQQRSQPESTERPVGVFGQIKQKYGPGW